MIHAPLLRLLRVAGLAAATCFAASAVFAVAPSRLVNDSVAFVLLVEDAPTLAKNWDSSPWGKTWNDPQVVRYLAPMRAQMKIDTWDDQLKGATGYTLREMLALAEGEALLAVTDLSPVVATEGKEPPSLLVAIDFGANAAKAEKLIADAINQKKKFLEETEEFAGKTLHTLKREKDGEAPKVDIVWAMADSVWLVAPTREPVVAALAGAQKGGVERPLAQSERWLRLREFGGKANFTACVNFAAIYPVAQKAIEDKAAANADKGANPFLPDMKTLLPTLGLDALQDLFVACEIGEHSTNVSSAITYTDQRGLLKMLTAYGNPPAARPDWIPAHWISASSSNFSVRQAWGALEQVVQDISPAAYGFYQQYLRNTSQQVGADLRKTLIDSLGGVIVTAYVPPAGTPAGKSVRAEDLSQFFAVAIDDATALSSGLDALKRLMGPAAEKVFTSREYLGKQIVTFTPPLPPGAPPAKGVSWCVTDKWLLVGVGSAQSIESALQGLAGGQKSFWDRADVRQALADVPDQAVEVQFVDLKALVPVVFDAFAQGASNAKQKATRPPGRGKPAPKAPPADSVQPSADEEAPPAQAEAAKPNGLVDLSARPDMEALAKYWSYATGHIRHDGSGVYSKGKIVHPRE
jgi:hypothetical protein